MGDVAVAMLSSRLRTAIAGATLNRLHTIRGKWHGVHSLQSRHAWPGSGCLHASTPPPRTLGPALMCTEGMGAALTATARSTLPAGASARALCTSSSAAAERRALTSLPLPQLRKRLKESVFTRRVAGGADVAAARAALGEMHARQQAGVLEWNMVLSACAKAQVGSPKGSDLATAQGVLADMVAAGVQPDVVTWNTMITACARATSCHGGADVDAAFALLDDMTAAGATPNVVSWTAAIDACAKAKVAARGGAGAGAATGAAVRRGADSARAWGAFHTMRRGGVAPSPQTLNALMHACVRSRQVDGGADVSGAWAVVELMRAGDDPALATPAPWNLLLRACGQACVGEGRGSDVEAACRVLAAMQEAGAAPDASTWAAYIDCAAGSKPSRSFVGANSLAAWQAFGEMVDAGAATSTTLKTLSTLLDASARSRQHNGGADVTGAWRAVDLMAHLRVPSVHAWNTLLFACSRGRTAATGGADIDSAWKALNFLRGTGVVPTLQTFNLVLETCSNARLDAGAGNGAGGADSTRAWQTFEALDAAGLEPDAATWGHLMEACVRSRQCLGGADLAGAWVVLDLMRARGVQPDATMWTRLVQACARACVGTTGGADVEAAWRVVDNTMPLAGARPDAATWSAFIQACANAKLSVGGGGGDVARAWSAYESMRAAGVQPTTATWAALLMACAQSRQVRGGADVAGAVRVLEEARRAGVTPSLDMWNHMLHTCAQARSGHGGGAAVDDAWLAMEGMQQAGVRPDASSWRHLIQACARAKLRSSAADSKRAWTAHQVMAASGVEPDLATWNALLSACALSRQVRGGADVRGAW